MKHDAADQARQPRPSGAPHMYTASGRLDTRAKLEQYSPLVLRLAHQVIA